ncbi:MAG: DUF3000 domain-containing protein, partial [Sciscionella sp.]
MTAEPTAPEVFRHAVRMLTSVRPRPEVQLEEIRAPKRLAPWAHALGGEACGPFEELATGRLILLHDPDSVVEWGGALRLVVFIRAELDAELGADPLLPEVAWSWLTDALDTPRAQLTALGGTVTRTSSARFGTITGPPRTDDLELRASWTATDADLGAHCEAFCELMGSTVGLPPVGVA